MRIEVSGLSRNFDSGCPNDWDLTADDVKFFFAHAQPVTLETWYLRYDVLPCSYIGKLLVAGHSYPFSINVQPYGAIRITPQSVVTFECGDQCKQLFPDGYGPQE